MTQVTVERNYGEKVKLIRKLAICPCHEQRIGVEQSIYIYRYKKIGVLEL